MAKYKYEIIYVDPPWDYGRTQHNGKSGTGSAGHHYNVMSIEDIKRLNIEGICTRDCLIFMWITGPHLSNSIDLLRAWGFEYRQVAFCWDKLRVNPGNYTMTQYEFVLVGKRKRGRIPRPRGARNVRQAVFEMRGAHSTKPECIADRIDEMFPYSKKIEIFARRKKQGWDCWGNELSGLDIYEPIRNILYRNKICKRINTT